MAAVQSGNSAGSPRCRPSANGTRSNQKNGPTPADSTQASIAARRSGTSQRACMKSRFGSGGGIIRAAADDREPFVAERLPWLHGGGVEIRTRRAVPADVTWLRDEDVRPARPVEHVRAGAVDRQVGVHGDVADLIGHRLRDLERAELR